MGEGRRKVQGGKQSHTFECAIDDCSAREMRRGLLDPRLRLVHRESHCDCSHNIERRRDKVGDTGSINTVRRTRDKTIRRDSLSVLHVGGTGVGKGLAGPFGSPTAAVDFGVDVKSDVDQGVGLGRFVLRRLEKGATRQANRNRGERVFKISR